VYLASTLSLAALEYLVHVDIEDLPSDLVAMQVRLPDDCGVETVALDQLPADWRATPDAAACQALGDDWIERGERLLLQVPSVVVPEERNVLLNPAHPDARRVRVLAQRPFTFDPRLL
jgi:RES domain-containing protein